MKCPLQKLADDQKQHDQMRKLLALMADHMAYMQGQLEAWHQEDDLEGYYWYRESVELRQRVNDIL